MALCHECKRLKFAQRHALQGTLWNPSCGHKSDFRGNVVTEKVAVLTHAT
jgi:hypothetical protein